MMVSQERQYPFRWRLVPTVLLGIFGVLLLLTGGLAHLLFWFIQMPNVATRNNYLLGCALLGLFGAVWCLSAWWWWYRAWWRATIAFLVGGWLGYAITLTPLG